MSQPQLLVDLCTNEKWEEFQRDENSIVLKYSFFFSEKKTSLSTTETELENRQLKVLSEIGELEARIAALEAQRKTGLAGSKRGGEPVTRVERALSGILSAQLQWVPENYYDLTIGQRRDILGCTIPQMLKTVFVENTACTSPDCSDPTNSRYYSVMVQYASRFNAERLLRVIRGLRPEETRLPRRKFNFQFAPEDVAKKITGFTKGAVTPFGLLSNIPIVLTDKVMSIHPSYIWMGGGHIHLKLGIAIKDFVDKLNPIVGDVAEMREDDVESSKD